MTGLRNGPVRLRPHVHALTLWLVLVALGLGCSRPPREGVSCTRRQNGGIGAREDRKREAPPTSESLARHPAFAEWIVERERMVATQIQARAIRDPNVLQAMRTVPRHEFVPESLRAYAYEDRPLPIGLEQTISQPYIVAFMTEALSLDLDAVVLEIGTGSGYQAAVCAEIAREVYSIEILEPLAQHAAGTLARLGYDGVHVRAGDGYFGWPEKGPFDAIIGTAAALGVPPPLIEQLKPGGRMILPVEGAYGLQSLILVVKDEQGELHSRNVLPVRFVPMTGRNRQSQE